MIPEYDPHASLTWYLYCIGCDLLTKVSRTTQNARIKDVVDNWNCKYRPLIRITYCTACALPFGDSIISGTWQNMTINVSLIDDTVLGQFVAGNHNGNALLCNGKKNRYVIENPNDVILSDEF